MPTKFDGRTLFMPVKYQPGKLKMVGTAHPTIITFMSLKKFILSFLISAACLGGNPYPVPAKTLQVPSEYPTIQKALEKAQNGDEIKVGPGIYQEQITLKDGISLSSDDAKKTTLTNTTNLDRPLITISGTASLIGFSIIGGNGGALGTVYVPEGSPNISLNMIHDNDSMGIVIQNGATPNIKENLIYNNRGAGINISAGKPNILNNEIFQNYGAGVYSQGGTPHIENNHIYKNSESGVAISYGASMGGNITARTEGEALIINNNIEDNKAAGIIAENTSPSIVGNTISNKGRPALLLFGSSAVIQKNTLISSGPPAIHINPGSSPIITENKISGTRRFPILGDTSNATIKDNQIEDSWQPKFFFK